MTQKANDEELASRAASGDAAAFRSLLEAHYDRVFRVAYSVMHSQSDAEDITQEVWAAMPALSRRSSRDKQTAVLAERSARDTLRRPSRNGGADARRGDEFRASRRCSWHCRRHGGVAHERDTAAAENARSKR